MRNSPLIPTLLSLTIVGLALGADDASAQAATDDAVQQAPSILTSDTDPVQFTVMNDHWTDMKIYVLSNGRRYRLGTVTSLREETFDLPGHVQADISEVRLLAVPISGTRGVVSPVVLTNPGEEIVWRLQNNLAFSGTPVR